MLVKSRKNIVYMSDEEFAKFLDECYEKQLTEEEINAIIDADCNAVLEIIEERRA